MRQKQPLALLSCDLHRKSVVPVVQNVPILQSVPDVEDVSEVIVLPELWRKTSVVVPDSPHRVVQPGVRRMDVVLFADDRQEYLDLLSQSASKHTLVRKPKSKVACHLFDLARDG